MSLKTTHLHLFFRHDSLPWFLDLIPNPEIHLVPYPVMFTFIYLPSYNPFLFITFYSITSSPLSQLGAFTFKCDSLRKMPENVLLREKIVFQALPAIQYVPTTSICCCTDKYSHRPYTNERTWLYSNKISFRETVSGQDTLLTLL